LAPDLILRANPRVWLDFAPDFPIRTSGNRVGPPDVAATQDVVVLAVSGHLFEEKAIIHLLTCGVAQSYACS
jgi:hypothetical protein